MTRTLAALLSLIAAALVSLTAPAAARQSAAPMRLAVLVDTSAGTSTSLHLIKSAVASFIEALPDGLEVLLVSTGRRTQVRVPPTTDRKRVAESANGLSADGGPTPLMESILEIDERFMRKGVRPVYVLVTSDGSESSRQGTAEKFNAWLPTLAPRHAVAHAVVLKLGNGFPEQIAKALVQATGGVFQTIGNAGALGDRLEAIAERIRGDATSQRVVIDCPRAATERRRDENSMKNLRAASLTRPRPFARARYRAGIQRAHAPSRWLRETSAMVGGAIRSWMFWSG